MVGGALLCITGTKLSTRRKFVWVRTPAILQVWPSAFNCSNKFRPQGINAPWLTDYCTNSLLFAIASMHGSNYLPWHARQPFLARSGRLGLPQPLHGHLQLYILINLTL
jgi:hypothetical protein